MVGKQFHMVLGAVTPWPASSPLSTSRDPLACLRGPPGQARAPLPASVTHFLIHGPSSILGVPGLLEDLLSSDFQKPSDMLQGPLTCFRGPLTDSVTPTLLQ